MVYSNGGNCAAVYSVYFFAFRKYNVINIDFGAKIWTYQSLCVGVDRNKKNEGSCNQILIYLIVA